MTWQDLYPQEPAFVGGSGGMIGSEPWRTQMRGTALSTGTQAIDAMGRRDKTAQELWERGLLEKANSDNEFLKTFANPGMQLNIQGAPRNPAEARRNAIIAAQQMQQKLTLENAAKGRVKDFGFQVSVDNRNRTIARQQLQDAIARARQRQSQQDQQFDQQLGREKFGLERTKAQDLSGYRNRSLSSRENIAKARLKSSDDRFSQTQYDNDLKAALKAVQDQGLDPDDAADIWDLDETDRERLRGYGEALDEGTPEDELIDQQTADYLNALAFPIRQQKQAEGATGPVVNGKQFPLPYLNQTELATVKSPTTGNPLMEEAIKLKALGRVQAGPRGFAPVRQQARPQSAPQSSQGLRFNPQGLPIVQTPQQRAMVPRGRKYVDGQGRVRIKQ